MGIYIVDCDETAKFIHFSANADLGVYVLDFQVFNAKELSSSV